MSKESEIMREHIRTHRTVLSMCGQPEDVILNKLLDDFESKDQRIAELEEQLKKMTPKFKVGQKIYMADCKEMSVFSATITKTIFTLHRENEHIHMYDIIKDIEPDWICGTSEEWLFATKEDALKKLKELKGE